MSLRELMVPCLSVSSPTEITLSGRLSTSSSDVVTRHARAPSFASRSACSLGREEGSESPVCDLIHEIITEVKLFVSLIIRDVIDH